MAYKSVISLKFKSADGKKISVKSGKIITVTMPDDLVSKWLDKGFIVKASVGEVAEAVASGAVEPSVLGGTTDEKLSSKAAAKGPKVGKTKAAEPAKTEPAADTTKSEGGADDDLA